MKQERFHLQFRWNNNERLLQIRTVGGTGIEPVISIYQVFWNDSHLFTIYPTFNDHANKVWKIVEQERETHLPPGFIGVLGSMIEEVYLSN